MKGAISGNRKRLAALTRQAYVMDRRGLPFSFCVDPPEPYNRQKELDYESDNRRCMLVYHARFGLSVRKHRKLTGVVRGNRKFLS